MTLSAAAPNSPMMTVMPASAASPLRAALQESACSSAMARRPGAEGRHRGFGEDDEPGPRLGGLTGERADLVEVLGHRGGRVDLSERELHSGPPEKRALRRRARAHHAVPLQ